MEFHPVVPAADNAPWLLRPPAQRRLTLAQVRVRLADLPAPTRRGGFPNVVEPKAAALFVPIGQVDGEAAVAITRRPNTMLRHRDVWVFPGGGFHPGEDRTTRDTALREASEELGVPPAEVTLIAQLNSYGPISSGFVVDVFVGLVDLARLKPDPREVAECRILPLSALATEEAYLESFDLPEFDPGPLAEGVVIDTGPRTTSVRFFDIGAEQHFWGLQGEVLHELLSLLLPAP